MNEKHLALFTPIKDNRLDLLANGEFIIRSVLNKTFSHEEVKISILDVKNGVIFYPNSWGGNVEHTHILDLGTLTTKQKAIELAEDAFDEGRKTSDYRQTASNEIKTTFINQNKERL